MMGTNWIADTPALMTATTVAGPPLLA